jgi:membrane protein implicated in regulation of membrane protease activity
MSEQAIWWVLAAILVGAELMTGTFYLLVYGLAAAAAGVAAWLGVGFVGQLLIAAVIGIAGTVALKKWRCSAATNENLQNLDIGQTVRVDNWQGKTGQVSYRGALWDAETKDDNVDVAKTLYIRAVRGTVLVVGN